MWVHVVQRVDGSTGFISAANHTGPTLARTVDAGATWSPITTPLEVVTSIRFFDADAGWVAGLADDTHSAVLRTVDGGASWQRVLLAPAAPGAYPPIQLQAIDRLTAWVLLPTCVGCRAELRRTVDGGSSWTTVVTAPIVAMRFVSATRGWIAVQPSSRADVELTTDGGATWTTRAHTESGSVISVEAAGTSAWVLTREGGYCSASTCTRYALTRTTDMGVTWADLGNPKPDNTPCSGGHLVGPLFVSGSLGWFAENTGAGGARASTGWLQSGDGGRTWKCSAAPSQVESVSAADSRHLWATMRRPGESTSSVLLASDDGGATWRSVGLPR
jgi:photosystem II stability/assembly factor-like uncharacterized protein